MKKDADFCISVLSVFQLRFRMGEATLRFSGMRFAAGESFAQCPRRESAAGTARCYPPIFRYSPGGIPQQLRNCLAKCS